MGPIWASNQVGVSIYRHSEIFIVILYPLNQVHVLMCRDSEIFIVILYTENVNFDNMFYLIHIIFTKNDLYYF
jgi:hypothetical protein